jgi:ABC-type phosphate transport system substrate-binding protein
MRYFPSALIVWLLLSGPGFAAGDLVVITNTASGVDKLTRDEAVNIFMGRYKKLPSGMTALPVDESSEKAAFYRALIGKELPEIQSYWARLVFSGQGSPPRPMENTKEVLEIVANNKGAIGYIDRKKVDGRVRIVLDLSR